MGNLLKTCRHDNDPKDCMWCGLHKKAEYDLTGTHDPEEQKQYWNDVWDHVRKLRRAKFKRKLQG